MSHGLAALVLAAGYGTRFGETSKLHALLDGEPVLSRCLRALEGLDLVETLVVVAPGDERAISLVRACGARAIPNPGRAAGLGHSLACGIRHLGTAAMGVMVLLGDMPGIRPASLLALATRWRQSGPTDILVPAYMGRRGHPVIFGSGHWPALGALTGDQGARQILEAHQEQRVTLALDDPGILLDVDTPEDLAAAQALPGRP
jgi:molybdenum cofactor cytidylyltransferase